VDEAIAGSTSVATTGGTTTLTSNNFTSDEARAAILEVTGTLGSNATIRLPAVSKLYVVDNSTTGSFTLTIDVSGGTGAVVPQGQVRQVKCDGTDCALVGVDTAGISAARIALGIAALPAVNALIITNNSSTPTTSVDIDADTAILLDTSNNAVLVSSVNLTVACAGTGANGLDTGSLANSTWYHFFIISNGTTTAGLASTSATSPTMPSGYTYKYRVGAIRTGGSATFVRIRQVGNRAQYEVVTSSTTPNLPIMVSGTSGSVTSPTWTAVATGSYVPPTARDIFGILNDTGGSARTMAAPNNDYGAYDSTSNPPPVMFGKNGGDVVHFSIPFHFVLESTDIYYASSNSNGKIACRGWVDAVNAN
jgi:hypothetical protein